MYDHKKYVELGYLNGLNFVLDSDLLLYSPINPNYAPNAFTPLTVLDVNRESTYLPNLTITGEYVNKEETMLEAIVDFDLENPLFIEIDTKDYRRLVEELSPDSVIDLDSDNPVSKNYRERTIPSHYELRHRLHSDCRITPKSKLYMNRHIFPMWMPEIARRRKILKRKNQQ